MSLGQTTNVVNADCKVYVGNLGDNGNEARALFSLSRVFWKNFQNFRSVQKTLFHKFDNYLLLKIIPHNWENNAKTKRKSWRASLASMASCDRSGWRSDRPVLPLSSLKIMTTQKVCPITFKWLIFVTEDIYSKDALEYNLCFRILSSCTIFTLNYQKLN